MWLAGLFIQQSIQLIMESFTYRGLTISIEQDDSPINPRVMFDPLSTIAYRSRSHILGDEQEPGIADADEFVIQVLGDEVYDDLEYLEDELYERYDNLMDAAENRYGDKDHDIRAYLIERRDLERNRLIEEIETRARRCAGQHYVYEELNHRQEGWAVGYISLADAIKEWGTDPSDAWKAKVKLHDGSTDLLQNIVKDQLGHEIREYIAWANGDVWSYAIENKEGETVDSCGGFYGEYGSDNWNYMIQYAKEAADEYVEQAIQKYDQAKEAMQDAHIPLCLLGEPPVFDEND